MEARSIEAVDLQPRAAVVPGGDSTAGGYQGHAEVERRRDDEAIGEVAEIGLR